MELGDWVALVGAISGLLAGVLVPLMTFVFTDRARRRERQADKEEKERAERQASAERAEQARTDLLKSLLPAISLLADYTPFEDASDEQIRRYIEEFRSDSVRRALDGIVLVGLVYPSVKAQVAAGSVQQGILNVVMILERALAARDDEGRRQNLRVAADVISRAENIIRDLAREIRGPLPWETGPAHTGSED